MTGEMPRLLTPREAAAILRTTPGSLANLRCKHLGPPITKIGTRVYYPEKELLEFIAARTTKPMPKAS